MKRRFNSAIESATATMIEAVPTCKPLALSWDLSLGDAVDAMKTAHRGACVVVDDAGRVHGMFTERDVVQQVDAGQAGWRERPLREATSLSTSVLRPGMTIGAALDEMNTGPFRRLPIIDELGRPYGIVSVWDVMSFIAEHYPQRFFNLPPRPDLETRQLWGG